MPYLLIRLGLEAQKRIMLVVSFKSALKLAFGYGCLRMSRKIYAKTDFFGKIYSAAV